MDLSEAVKGSLVVDGGLGRNSNAAVSGLADS